MTNVPILRFKEFSGEWEAKKLGDITIKTGIKNKNSIDYEVYSISNKYGFIPQDEQFENSRLSELDKTSYQVVSKGEFAYNPARINVGSIGVLEEDKTVIVSSLYVCFKLLDNLNYRLFKTYFKTYKFNKDVIRNTEGSVREYLFYENFSRIKVHIPDIKEQEKIAAFFSLIDKKIELQTEKVEELKNYKKGMLQKMFPRNGETAPELRFAGFTDAWEQRKFKDFITKSGKKNTLNGDYQPYSVSNKLGLVSQTEQFDGSRLDDLGKTSYKLVEPGDFVYNPARVNVGSIAFNNLNKTVIVSSLYVILKMSDQLDNEFVLQYIKSQEFINEVKRNTEGSVREYLFYENFKNVKFPYTSNKDEQIKIGAYFKNLDNLITLHQDKLNALNEYKKGLLQQMFI